MSSWFSMAFVSPRELVGGPYDEALRVLDVDSGAERPFAPSRAGGRDVSLTRDGETFALSERGGEVSIRTRAASKRATVPGSQSDGHELVALSSDGRRLAYTHDRRVIIVRERSVPRDPETLRAWVLEHRVR